MTYSNLMKRSITAVVGISLILGLIVYGGSWGTTLLAWSCCTVALMEYFYMVFPVNEEYLFQRVAMFIGFVLATLVIFDSEYLFAAVSFLSLLLFIFFFFLSSYFYGGNHPYFFARLSYSLMGIFYIGFLFSFWPKIRALPQGVHWIFLVFLICWLTDIFAFFVGKGWGRKKLAPNLSPNKTVEGALAGIAASTIGVVIYKMTFFHELSWLDSFILGIVGSILSQMGDLFESFVKRSFSVKDSGVVIPGHGGILDRFDGVLFCAPFLYFYARFW